VLSVGFDLRHGGLADAFRGTLAAFCQRGLFAFGHGFILARSHGNRLHVVRRVELPDGIDRRDFAARPSSTRRRMASGLDGRGVGCALIQSSSCSRWSDLRLILAEGCPMIAATR
jgi:hypothetical protein